MSPRSRSRRAFLATTTALAATGIAGCLGGDEDDGFEGDWIDAPLTDVRTGESFTIADYTDRPLLLESFAAWCPACTDQQREKQALIAAYPDAANAISLNTDPNEDEDRVIEYQERHGFDWPFAVAQPSLTSTLVDEFTEDVVNAPAAPVVLVCPDGDRRLLQPRVKSAATLHDATQTC